MAEISSMPGQSGHNCEGDDEPGHSIIDNIRLFEKKITVTNVYSSL